MEGVEFKVIFKEGLLNRILNFLKRILNFFGISFISKQEENEAKLIKAIEDQDFREVERLISLGVNINLKDKNGDTILMKAVDKNNSGIVELLLGGQDNYTLPFSRNNKGANIEIKDRNGETVLFRAVRNCYVDIVDVLVSNGANILVKNKDKKTVQEIAFECKNKIIIKLNRDYKYIFDEIKKYNKNKDNIHVLKDMLERIEEYKDKVIELDRTIKSDSLDEVELNNLIDEQKRCSGILDILANKGKYEVFSKELKKIEDCEEIKDILENSYLFNQKDYTQNVSIKGKFRMKGKNEIPKEDLERENEVLFDYDLKGSNKENRNDRENNL